VRPFRVLPGFLLLVAVPVGLALVHGCRDVPEPTESEPAAAIAPGPLAAAASAVATTGRWGAKFSTPVVAVHMHLLPTGRVLFWGDRGGAQLWDPAHPAAGFTAMAKIYRIFCSGHTFLPDGRLLVTGGTITGTSGEARGALFDPASGAWSAAGPMAQGRYYPTTTTLPSGNILAVSGNDANGNVVLIPEIGNGRTWRRLTTASLSIPKPFYPAMFVAPNGKVFLAGFPQTSRYLSVAGTGRWTTVGNRRVADRTMGSAVMYAPGKILYAAGGDPPTSSAEVIDLTRPAPAWRSIAPMRFPRRQMNTTLLADGQVLITSGTSGPGFNDVTSPVYAAELWNPATEAWTTMARESVGRTYHSTALLLPDGRVLSSGSGEGGGVPFESSQLSAQVFSPPYLFNPDGTLATRPVITSAPSRITYGQPFTVRTPDAAAVTRGTLIRLGSVTHAFNQSQLIFPLTFSAAGATTLTATGPSSASWATPGPYMLFLVNGNGVPSTARMVTVGP
jgi:galactose oxidase